MKFNFSKLDSNVYEAFTKVVEKKTQEIEEYFTSQRQSMTPTQFETQLSRLKEKADALKKRGHSDAAQVADKLHDNLTAEYESLDTQDPITVSSFKLKCTELIDKSRPVLEQHRGWKKFLGNLELMIIYVADLVTNTRYMGRILFFKTDSAEKLDRLQDEVKSIDKPDM